MDLLNIVTARVDVTQSALKTMREEIGALDSRIRNEVSQLGKRPRYTQAELDRNLKASEHQHAHSSLSNKEERALMKEMEVMKKDMKSLVEFTARQSKVDEMKEEKARLQESMREDMNKLNDLQFYARKLKLAAEHQVEFSSIVDITMKFAEDRLGVVIGKNGNTLDKLENTFKVCIDADRAIPGVRIMGLGPAIESCREAIQEIVNTVSEELSLGEVLISTLITIMTKSEGNSTPNAITDLLSNQNVRLDVSKSKGLCKITGHADQIDAMRSAIESLECSKRVLTIDVAVIPHIIGKGGSTVNQLGDEHSVQIDVEKEKGSITVTGLTANVTAASDAILALHEERREVEEDIPMTRSIMMNIVVGDKSNPIIKELQKTLNVRLSFDKAEADSGLPDILHIKGPTAQVGTAKAHINELVSSYMSQTIILAVPLDVIPAIIGKSGANMKALKASYPEAQIDIEDGGKVSIHASTTIVREQARNAIEKFVQSNYQETINYEADAMVALKSTRGKETCKFIQEMSIMMDLDDTVTPPSIRLKGDKENVNTAITVLKEFLVDNQHWITSCSDDEMSSLTNGGDNSLRKKLEAEFDVEVYISRKDGGWLRIRGSTENIEKAKEHMYSTLKGDLSFNSYILELGSVNMNVLIGKGGQNIKKMEESNPDVVFDLLKASNQIRLRGPLSSISKAKWDVLSSVDTLKSFAIVDIPVECQNLTNLRAFFGTVAAVCNVELKLEDDMNNKSKKGNKESRESGKDGKEGTKDAGKDGKDSKDSKDSKDGKDGKDGKDPSSPPTEVTIRGDLSAIESAKTKLQEYFTGIATRSIPFFITDPGTVLPLTTVIKALVNKYNLNSSNKKTPYLVLDPDTAAIELSCSVHKSDEISMALYSHLSTHLKPYYLVQSVPKKFLREMKQFSIIEEIDEKCDCLTSVDRNNGILLITAKADNTHGVAALKRARCIIEERHSVFEASLVTIPIEEYMIVLLVGKQGATITALQKDTGVNIQVNRQALLLELTCSDVATLESAAVTVGERVEAMKSEYWTIKVDKASIGQIIGKGGNNAKKLRETTGAVISIDAGTNIIEVTGGADKVKAAREAIEEIIATEKVNSDVVYLRIPTNAQASIIGAKGAMANEIQSKSGARMDLDRSNNIIKLRGSAASKQKGKEMILALLKEAGYEESMYSVVTEVEAYPPFSKSSSSNNNTSTGGNGSSSSSSDDNEKESAVETSPMNMKSIPGAYQLSKSALKRQRQREKREKKVGTSTSTESAASITTSTTSAASYGESNAAATSPSEKEAAASLNDLSLGNDNGNAVSTVEEEAEHEPYVSSAERRALERSEAVKVRTIVEESKAAATTPAKNTSKASNSSSSSGGNVSSNNSSTTSSSSSSSSNAKATNQPTKRDIAKNLINTGMDGKTIAIACQNFAWTADKQALVAGLVEDGCDPQLAEDIATHSRLSTASASNNKSSAGSGSATSSSTAKREVPAAATGGVAESKSAKIADASVLSHQSSTDDILDMLAAIGGSTSAPRQSYRSSNSSSGASSTTTPATSTVAPGASNGSAGNGSSTSSTASTTSTTSTTTAAGTAAVKPKGAPTATKKAWGK